MHSMSLRETRARIGKHVQVFSQFISKMPSYTAAPLTVAMYCSLIGAKLELSGLYLVIATVLVVVLLLLSSRALASRWKKATLLKYKRNDEVYSFVENLKSLKPAGIEAIAERTIAKARDSEIKHMVHSAWLSSLVQSATDILPLILVSFGVLIQHLMNGSL